MNKSEIEARNNHFQHCVLNLLWVIALFVVGKKPIQQLLNCRSDCIAFGNQSEEAKEYRRNNTYWYIY